jgi:L-fucono-1,5-lactonase
MTTGIDAHQHFWRTDRGDYGWLTPDVGPLYRDYTPDDLEPLLAACGVARTVLVQAAPTTGETRFLLDLAANCSFIAGVVGWVDMDDVASAETTLAEFARHAKFVGVRPMIQDIADPTWITRPELGPVVEQLVATGLRFDALVKPVHLPFLLEFLERHPDLGCVIDHGAKPGIAANSWSPWAEDILAIARRTSACCKLSGLLTEAAPGQSRADIAPYVDHLLAAFGSRRLIWGSDWPVLNLAGSYRRWRTDSESLLSGLSADEQALIFGGNAIDFYGLVPG